MYSFEFTSLKFDWFSWGFAPSIVKGVELQSIFINLLVVIRRMDACSTDKVDQVTETI